MMKIVENVTEHLIGYATLGKPQRALSCLAVLLLLVGAVTAAQAQSPAPAAARARRKIARKPHAGPALSAAVISEVNLEGLKAVLARSPTARRPLLINFWATWCDPCREEFPDLVKIDADYRARGLDVAAVSFDFPEDKGTTVPAFLKQMKARMPVYLFSEPDQEPAIKLVDADWGGGIPSTYLFDGDGKIVFKYMGRFKPLELRRQIDKLLGAAN